MNDTDSFRLLSSVVADSIIGWIGAIGVLVWLLDTLIARLG